MKPIINLRLCIAGIPDLLTEFDRCLHSYTDHYDINILYIYTTLNLKEQVLEIIEKYPVVQLPIIFDVDSFYVDNYDQFPNSVKTVLDYSKDKAFKGSHSMFYLRIRLVMDHYLLPESKPFILSDIDIRMFDNTAPITEWLDSIQNNDPYILYAADFLEEYYAHSQIITSLLTKPHLDTVPYFNDGWMCIPPHTKYNLDYVFDILKLDLDCCPAEMACVASDIINQNIKTKLIPQSDLVLPLNWFTQTNKLSELNTKDKFMVHLGPYGIKE